MLIVRLIDREGSVRAMRLCGTKPFGKWAYQLAGPAVEREVLGELVRETKPLGERVV